MAGPDRIEGHAAASPGRAGCALVQVILGDARQRHFGCRWLEGRGGRDIGDPEVTAGGEEQAFTIRHPNRWGATLYETACLASVHRDQEDAGDGHSGSRHGHGAAVWRKAGLLDAGGLSVDTLPGEGEVGALSGVGRGRHRENQCENSCAYRTDLRLQRGPPKRVGRGSAMDGSGRKGRAVPVPVPYTSSQGWWTAAPVSAPPERVVEARCDSIPLSAQS